MQPARLRHGFRFDETAVLPQPSFRRPNPITTPLIAVHNVPAIRIVSDPSLSSFSKNPLIGTVAFTHVSGVVSEPAVTFGRVDVANKQGSLAAVEIHLLPGVVPKLNLSGFSDLALEEVEFSGRARLTAGSKAIVPRSRGAHFDISNNSLLVIGSATGSLTLVADSGKQAGTVATIDQVALNQLALRLGAKSDVEIGGGHVHQVSYLITPPSRKGEVVRSEGKVRAANVTVADFFNGPEVGFERSALV